MIRFSYINRGRFNLKNLISVHKYSLVEMVLHLMAYNFKLKRKRLNKQVLTYSSTNFIQKLIIENSPS